MNELQILTAISNVSSKNAKIDLLKAACNNTRMQDLLDAAFNYNRKFLIKNWNITTPTLIEQDKHSEFIHLIKYLESGEGRGDTAKTKVEHFFSELSSEQQKWYSRIIRKDLKAGFSAETAAKCGFDIPIFNVMLAKDGNKMKNLSTFIAKGGYASKKLDGYRCLAFVINGEVTLYSRNGTIYENFPSIEQALQQCCGTDNYIFDGEIMSDDFQSMQKSAFASKRGTTVGDVKYHIFDLIPHNEWVNQKFITKKSLRINNLCNFFENHVDTSLLQQVEQELVDSLSSLKNKEQLYTSQGYEGAMFVPDIPYYFGKKANKMIKIKTMLSMEVEITGFNEGEANSKYAGTLGAFTVKQENGLTCKVGSGLSDDDRNYIWSNLDKFIGRIFEAKYQELSNDNIMRFPVFIRWRDTGANSGKI